MNMDYTYTHTQTLATTGYFSCDPALDISEEDLLAQLEASPMDDFLHLYILREYCKKNLDELKGRVASCLDACEGGFRRPALAALLLECAYLMPDLAPLRDDFPPDALCHLSGMSPLVYLRAQEMPDRAAAAYWSGLFRKNICEHRPLPRLEEAGMPPLFSEEALSAAAREMYARFSVLESEHARLEKAHEESPSDDADVVPPLSEVVRNAADALMEAGVLAGTEMRHEASLSPIALLRTWNVDVGVKNGALSYTLRGTATAYGRGLSLAQTRASYLMEIVERASAYVSVGEGGAYGDGLILGRKHPLDLVRATFAELQAQGRAALSPSLLPIEAPFPAGPVHWVGACDADGKSVLVPAQAVFLFCNLDEQGIFLAGGSTGLASGSVMDGAKVSALTEILERDAEATTPFSRARCFTLASRDRMLQSLLDDYAARGIRVQFQDLTTEFGLPVYQCFVTAPDGRVARATAGKLSGPAACLAALTETPWPYVWAKPAPYGKPSGPGLQGLPVRVLEDLPDYSLPTARACRELLESMLRAHGRTPLYVDLTREDIDLPVCRAIVPGLELTAEWDSWSRPPLRLFARAWMQQNS